MPYLERITSQPGLVLDFIVGKNLSFTSPAVCSWAVCGSMSDHVPIWATAVLP